MPHLSRVMGEDKKKESKCSGENLGWELYRSEPLFFPLFCGFNIVFKKQRT